MHLIMKDTVYIALLLLGAVLYMMKGKETTVTSTCFDNNITSCVHHLCSLIRYTQMHLLHTVINLCFVIIAHQNCGVLQNILYNFQHIIYQHIHMYISIHKGIYFMLLTLFKQQCHSGHVKYSCSQGFVTYYNLNPFLQQHETCNVIVMNLEGAVTKETISICIMHLIQ